MPIPKEVIRAIRRMDTYDLRRLQMLVRGLLEADEAPGPTATPRGRVTFRQEHVRCGKRSCTRCPHGPYWYAYWREGGRMRSRYLGKERPGEANLPG